MEVEMKSGPARHAPSWRVPMLAVIVAGSLGAGCAASSGSPGGSGSGGATGSGGRGGGGSGGSAGSMGNATTGGAGGGSGGTGGSAGSGGSTGGVGAGGSGASSGGAAGGVGGAGGSGGAGGAGTGGSGGSGGSSGGSTDGPPADTISTMVDMGGPDYMPLTPCPKPSVDHLEVWRAHGGSLRPAAGGTILTQEAGKTIAKVEFLPGGEWHEIVVPVMNDQTKKVDLTSSAGFTITYSAVADLHVQLRPLSYAHGGAQWTAKLPATGGMTRELFVPFAPGSWGNLLGPPPFPFSQALRDANFFDFVGPPGTANTFIVRGLRFDKHVPPCS